MSSSSPAGPTRDRILDVAMELFSTRGFRGTSIVQIEKAAGLTPGAGGIYHHFRTKEALLRAGIERQLARLDALRTIKEALGPLGDLRAELTIIARYTIAELGREQELIQIMAAECRNHPELMEEAGRTVFGAAYEQFTDSLRSAGLDPDRAAVVASVGFSALVSKQMLSIVFCTDQLSALPQIDDETYIFTWVDMMESAITR